MNHETTALPRSDEPLDRTPADQPPPTGKYRRTPGTCPAWSGDHSVLQMERQNALWLGGRGRIHQNPTPHALVFSGTASDRHRVRRRVTKDNQCLSGDLAATQGIGRQTLRLVTLH
jgi:hypothetical protein